MDERAQLAFAEIIGEGDQTVLLLDRSAGRVTAGVLQSKFRPGCERDIGGRPRSDWGRGQQGNAHSPLGSWRAISCECTEANLAIGPVGGDAVVLVAASPAVPMGFRQTIARSCSRARAGMARGSRLMSEYDSVVEHIERQSGSSFGAMLVGIDDGMVIARTTGLGDTGSRHGGSGLSLFRKTRQAADDAGSAQRLSCASRPIAGM
jgi:hypothetical protein